MIARHAIPTCNGVPVYDRESGSLVCNVCGAEELLQESPSSNLKPSNPLLMAKLGSAPYLSATDFVGRAAKNVVTVPQLLSDGSERNQRIEKLAEQICTDLRMEARLPEVVSRTKAIIDDMERRGKKKITLWKPLFYAIVQVMKRAPSATQFRTIREITKPFERYVPSFKAAYGRDEKVVMNLLNEIQKYTEAEYVQADVSTYILRYTLGLQNFAFVHDEVSREYGIRSKLTVISELCDCAIKLADSIQKRPNQDAEYINEILQGLRPTTKAAVYLLLGNYILGRRKHRVLSARTICRAIDVIDGRDSENGEGSYGLVKDYLLAITSRVSGGRK
jgi:hypothetical protein